MNNVLSLLTSACGWLADPIGLTRWTQTGKSQPSVLSPATGPDGSFFFFPVEETYCTHYTGFFVGAGLTCCRWNKEDLADSAIVTEVLKLTVWAAYQLPRYVRISDLQSYIIQLPVCVDYMSGRNWISDGVKRISLRHCVHARSGPTCLVSSYYRVLFWRRQNGRVATLTSFSTYCTIFWTVSVATVLWTSWCGCELDT